MNKLSIYLGEMLYAASLVCAVLFPICFVAALGIIVFARSFEGEQLLLPILAILLKIPNFLFGYLALRILPVSAHDRIKNSMKTLWGPLLLGISILILLIAVMQLVQLDG